MPSNKKEWDNIAQRADNRLGALTKKQVDKYLHDLRCPLCGGVVGSIFDDIERYIDCATIAVFCNQCGAKFIETYKLVDVMLTSDGGDVYEDV